jgi:phage FluMu gp28-like protein
VNGVLDYFLPYQVDWLNDASPFALAEKSRRVGWTYVHAYGRVERAVKGVCNGYFSSADLTAAREFIDYCKTWSEVFNAVAVEHTETAVIDQDEITTLVLTFNSGRKIVAGSSNPKFFRSKGGDADGDEFAFHAQGRELLKAMHATALFWGYRLRLWSTHNGEGSYFNQLLKAARAGQLNARVHRVTILDAVEQGLVEKIRKLSQPDALARREWLEELRSTCPDEDTWQEEYLCNPSSDHGSLLGYELIQACEVANLQLIEDPAQLPEGTYYAGFDVGRKRDLSVLWVDQKVGDVYWTRVLRELADVNFTAQEDLLHRLLANRSVKRLCIDSTGIGMMLAERLQGRWGAYRVEAVNFSAPVKSEIAMPLVRRFQDRACRIPMDAAVREDLHAVRKTVTAAGNVRLDAERSEDGHADRFWAAALACHASDPSKTPLPAPLMRKPVGW